MSETLEQQKQRYLILLREGCPRCEFDESEGELFRHCSNCQLQLTGLSYEIFIQNGVLIGPRKGTKTPPEFSNGLTKAQEEMFQLLEEECAELIQAVSKIKRHGMDDKSRIDNLYEEAGDVVACLGILTHNRLLDTKGVNEIAREKLDRLRDPKTKRVHFITPEMLP